MCLVSFNKTKSGKTILTSNRDEAPTRAADSLQVDKLEDQNILYPQDTKGGSWFVVGSSGGVAIVLNGAFKDHKRILPYRLSRGIMLKQLFEFSAPHKFLNEYDFVNIEPFTMVIFSEGQLLEFRWDGSKKYIEILDVSQCHVWSSCTLYDKMNQLKREEEFLKLIDSKSELEADDIWDIHLNGSVNDKANNFVMNREDRVLTMSVTQAEIGEATIKLNYRNLIHQVDHHQSMAIEK